MTDAPKVPSTLSLLWTLVWHPVKLRRQLHSLGIYEPNTAGLRLWLNALRRRHLEVQYFRRMVFLMGIVTPLTAFILAIVIGAKTPDFRVEWVELGVGIAVGLIGGMICTSFVSMALGLTWAIAWAAATGILGGVETHVVDWAIAFGIGWSFCLNVGFGIASGKPLNLGSCIGAGVISGILFGMVQNVFSTMDLWADTLLGLLAGFIFIASILRVFSYPLEVALELILYSLQKFLRIPSLKFSPVFQQGLSYFPYPFLSRHIVLAAQQDPTIVHRALDACKLTPGQQASGREALSRLQALELEHQAKQKNFAPVTELQGDWLPGVEGANQYLLGFREAARYLLAATNANIPYHQLQHLMRAKRVLISLENQLIASPSPQADSLEEALQIWKDATTDLYKAAQTASVSQVPNPFRVEPLTPDRGREVFRGRDDLVRRIETLLVDPAQSASIALLGPRRCGKTSLLRMLPTLLPDALCIFFDLQDNPVNSPAAFFEALVRQAQAQANRDRRLTLPPLPPGDPFEAGSQWFKSLEDLDGDYRILICIDEFEELENLFPGEKRELLQLMGLFRATIQHQRRLKLLVSGAAPFDELGDLWNKHFVNVREVKIGYLEQAVSRDLLLHPLPDFPGDVMSEPIADTIFQRTGGLPYLLQLYASLLITYLNDQKRRQARMGDLPIVEDEVLTQASYYLRHTFESAPAEAKPALTAIALDRSIEISVRTRRWLRQRWLLTEQDQLWVPVLGTWLREEMEL